MVNLFQPHSWSAVQQAAEAGERLSEAEAVERLVAEGPPAAGARAAAPCRAQLKGEKAERLLATARELAEEPDEAARIVGQARGDC